MKYFVNFAGKSFGPLDEEKIVEMYLAGRFKDNVEISRDKKFWESIETILPPPPQPELPPVQEPMEEEQVDVLLPVTGELSPMIDAQTSDAVWFYSVDGSKGYGPVTESDLGNMLHCGMLKTSSLVWRQGENSRPISVVPELVDILLANMSSSSSDGNGDAPPIPPIPEDYSYGGNDSFSNPDRKKSGLSLFGSGANSSANLMEGLEFEGPFKDAGQVPVGRTSRMSYALMALFFGQLGIHNFYASRMDIAIVQLFIGLTNLIGLIVISFVSFATEGSGQFLFIIPSIIGFGLELWAVIEACTVITDGTGRRMY